LDRNRTSIVFSLNSTDTKRKPTNVWHLLDKEEGYTICGMREMFTWDNADMIPNNNRVCKRCEAKAHGQGVEIVK
jgi:hypothetical protein